MKFKRSIDEEGELIPTASMADITFLLIIFFMVGTVFNEDRGLEMRLPQTTVQQELPENNVTITIDAKELIYLDGEETGLGDIGKASREKLAGRPDGFVLVKCDQGVKYSKVVDVLDELLQVGITNIALPTDKEEL